MCNLVVLRWLSFPIVVDPMNVFDGPTFWAKLKLTLKMELLTPRKEKKQKGTHEFLFHQRDFEPIDLILIMVSLVTQ